MTEPMVHVAPNSFDPTDPLLDVIERPDWRWESLERTLQQTGARGVMSRLPLFWQTEIPLFKAARAAGAFLFLNDAKNMPVGAEALKRAEVDVVVTDIADAYTFAEYLEKVQAPFGTLWFIIHPLEKRALPPQLLRLGVQVHEEVHQTPCVPREEKA